jgi:hypothetical protein
MSIWTDGLPAWWAMAVAVAALLAGVLLGELHGRGVGRGQEREDQKARRVARQFRRIPHVPAHERPRGERTAAFLNPPEVHHEDPGMTLAEADEYWAGVAHEDHRRRQPQWPGFDADQQAHEAWLAHTDLAIDLANDDPTVSAWTQAAAERMDAFLERLLAEHPVPYLPGEEDQ